MGTVGSIVGDDAARRLRNVDDVNRQLYEMYDAGAVATFSHRVEPSRHDAAQTVDVWDVQYAGEDRCWTYPYSQVRALLRGWRLGRRHGFRAAP